MTRLAAPTLAPRLDRSLDLDVVVLATNRAEVLDATVRRLHAALTVGLSTTWRLTIVDHASHDGTAEVAERMARELAGVRSERVAEPLSRAAMHARWASSPAVAVTFVELAPGLDIDATVALLARWAASAPVRPHLRPMSRRTALAGIGGLGLTAVLAACGRSGTGSSATTTAATSAASASTTSASGAASTASASATSATSAATGSTATTSAATGSTASSAAAEVVLVPELTEGPYYLDLDLVRSDIREDRQGAPLVLDMRVVDAATGDPIPGASVDLWHCDAEGEYSGFVSASEGDTGGRSGPGGGAPPSGGGGGGGGATATDDSIFLRGTQVAADDGAVRFTTVYPGWYTGRSVHMHIKVHVSGDVTHTSQLFFDDAFTDEVYASTEPYASQGERDQRNDDDGIFGQGGEAMTLDVAASGSGYASAITLGVDGGVDGDGGVGG